MRFYSFAPTPQIQFDLVALAKDKNKERSRWIYALSGRNLLMEEGNGMLCYHFADTDLFAFYVMLYKEEGDVILRL